MAKISKYFTVTKHLPNRLGQIEFSGIVYNDDPENYDIEDVVFYAPKTTENITQWFHAFRAITDPEFHHEDITELLAEWIVSDEANPHYSRLNEAA